MSAVHEVLRKLKNSPGLLKHQLHTQWPQIFGFEVKGELVQYYRNDSIFKTALSFNHFVEFFTKYTQMRIEIFVQAYSRSGQHLGKGSFKIQGQGSLQIPLETLIPNLDDFGLFSVSMKIEPHFVPELDYVGALSPQFMTILIPQDGKSAPQMLHSHKMKQGRFVMKRNHQRSSSHLELITDLEDLEIFFLNSGGAEMLAGLEILDSATGKKIEESHFQIPAYGSKSVKLSSQDLQRQDTRAITFRYLFNRSVDHKKPILFRHFKSGVYSCNHT